VPGSKRHNGILVLISASLLTAVLGSVHAFSVFLIPLETNLSASRSMVSLTYSLALVSLTIAVLHGHRLYSRWSVDRFVLLICLIAAFGASIAAFAPSLSIVWLGFGVLFGGANGLGYGFGLQIAAQARPNREGASMGIVTAAYGFGAAVSPVLFTYALSVGGFRAAMLGLSGALIVAALLCTLLFRLSKATFRSISDQSPKSPSTPRITFLLWLGYGAGVASGLMAIGHATGIATALNHNGAHWIAPAVISASGLAGSLIAGRLIDRSAATSLLIGLPLISAVAVVLLAIFGGASIVMIYLAVVGLTYGGIIATYPAAISKRFGVLDGPQVYGRVFTAWGFAGLFAPWFAGFLFDWTGSYRLALLAAGVLGVVSATTMLVYGRHAS
jgi:OFA family oxalate/formate antiporter-like MFS transporter